MRVLFTGTRVSGVEYVQDGKVHESGAGEVILSGGAVNSPQLLMLSGIGPAGHLRDMGIAVRVDLPGVGQNLQDHLLSGASYACRRRGTLDNAGTMLDLIWYLLFGRGRLTSNVGEAGAFVRSDPAAPLPDLQLYFAPVYYVAHGFDRPPGAGFSIGACVLRPRSRGEVRLRSADPLAAPSIQPRYLDDPDDLRLQLLGLKLARRLAASKAFAGVRGEEYVPGASLQSDEELTADIRQRVETLYHPVGTCKMGRDALAVVDPGLRVHGTTGLRVVDASIMPALIGGNTHAPTVMIAEKAVDLIRGTSLPREEVA
jgi:choline dehydrogenase